MNRIAWIGIGIVFSLSVVAIGQNTVIDDDEQSDQRIVLDETTPERLQSLETIRPSQIFGDPVKADVDNDGSEELIVTTNGNVVHVISADGSTRSVRLEGLPQQYPAYIRVISIDGIPHFAAGTQIDAPAAVTRCYTGVWQTDGRQVWMEQLKLPDNTAVFPLFATHDITGDGDEELLLAFTATRFDEQYELDLASQSSYLSIYNTAGDLLTMRQLPDMARSIEFIADDRGITILHVITITTVLRFRFETSAIQLTE